MSKGRVFLVGAGCGDYDLITLRGKALLSRAEVIVYDSLIDKRLLDYAPDDAEKICVGKRAGRHSTDQGDINRLLVEKALEGKTIVRLKGGDPFVFGRGGEEILSLQEHGIEYAVVPGISSAIAVPELAGIPLTHRGLSRAFHVFTAHTKEDALPENIDAYAKLDGTLVILMGFSKLSEIAAALIKNGKPEDTPAAVISNGASAYARTVRGTLGDITRRVKAAKLTAPAVIVIGNAAELDLKLTLKSVSVVGTKSFCHRLYQQLILIGCSLKCYDLLDAAAYDNFDDVLLKLSNYTAVAFTSTNGVDLFFESVKRLHLDIRQLSHLQFAVVGKGTAQALASHDIYADILPEKFFAVSLAEALTKQLTKNDKLLLLRAQQGSTELNKILDENNIPYDDVKIYDVSEREGLSPEHIGTDYLVFASPSGVRVFFDSGYTVSEYTQAIAIGSTTADELTKYDITDILLPDESTTDGIVRLIEKEQLCSDSDD